MTHTTREAWLVDLTNLLRPVFTGYGYPIPTAAHFSCGFPSRRALKSEKSYMVGQCWAPQASAHAYNEIMISPTVADAGAVAEILAHELCHAAVGCEHGHKGPFATLARAIGLEGKLTATHGGEAFKRTVAPLLETVGPYPHGALDARVGKKTQTTRLIKVSCPECGYPARITRKWLDEAGAPICPEHGIPMEA